MARELALVFTGLDRIESARRRKGSWIGDDVDNVTPVLDKMLKK